MKTILFKGIVFSAIILSSLYGCKKEETATEFIADNNTFTSFKNWSLEKTYHGPDPLLGQGAHANNDSTVVREVYFKNGQDAVNGIYPLGTLVVKNSYNPDRSINEFVAMSKRGNGFNPDGNDWEYFVLNADGTIATVNDEPVRGAKIMGGMCITCHSTTSQTDYIFSK